MTTKLHQSLMRELKDRLTKARAALGWSQQDLADASEVAAQQISRYEAGRSMPRAEIAAKLARALHVRFEWFMEGAGEPGLDESVVTHEFLLPGTAIIGAEVSSELSAAFRKKAADMGLTPEGLLRQLVVAYVDDNEPNLADFRDKINGLQEQINELQMKAMRQFTNALNAGELRAAPGGGYERGPTFGMGSATKLGKPKS